MKNKRQKSSIYHHSTKTKARKQEVFPEFYTENPQVFDNQAFSATADQKIARGEQGKNFQWSRNIHGSAPFFMDTNASEGDLYSTDMPSDDVKPEDLHPDYKYKQKSETETYCYDYTNSQFIYFLGQLKPKDYLLFITLGAMLITNPLNVTEKRIVFAFVSNLADSIQTLYEQEVILASYQQTKGIRDLNNALHMDFENIYREIGRLKRPRP